MKRMLAVVAALSVLGVSGGALAQGRPAAEAKPKPEVLNYDEAGVLGRDRLPTSGFTLGKAQAKFANLIKLRGNFQPELTASTDSL